MTPSLPQGSWLKHHSFSGQVSFLGSFRGLLFMLVSHCLRPYLRLRRIRRAPAAERSSSARARGFRHYCQSRPERRSRAFARGKSRVQDRVICCVARGVSSDEEARQVVRIGVQKSPQARVIRNGNRLIEIAQGSCECRQGGVAVGKDGSAIGCAIATIVHSRRIDVSKWRGRRGAATRKTGFSTSFHEVLACKSVANPEKVKGHRSGSTPVEVIDIKAQAGAGNIVRCRAGPREKPLRSKRRKPLRLVVPLRAANLTFRFASVPKLVPETSAPPALVPR